jgi:general secretion pathway protein G
MTPVREPRMRSRCRGGFTLVEIMVVVIIIGILATLVIANVGGQGDQARLKTTKALMAQVASQLELFKMAHGRFPDSLEDLVTMPNYVSKPETWPQGGYLKELPEDGWGNKLVYRRNTSSTNRGFDLVSLGADGKEGGDGMDKDIPY